LPARRGIQKPRDKKLDPYVAEYVHRDGVDGPRLQRLNESSLGDARASGEAQAPEGFKLLALYGPVWRRAEEDEEEE